jgi:hypothetical protein
MRIRQRDALVAYILQQLGDEYAGNLIPSTTNGVALTGASQLTLATSGIVETGMSVDGVNIAPGTTVIGVNGDIITISPGTQAALPSNSNLVFARAGASPINTPDKLFEYFLIDVEMQPPVETSRIRLALSSVQLFIERILRNLEPDVSPTDIDGALWTWMKRYRVWQANREVFLWPENWLYPELRDDQSPLFQQMMSSLLQGDITDEAAASAYIDYLTNLEKIAKLEPCGLYYQPGGSDSDETSYVVARTAGGDRKYYFRTLQYGSWTPWTQVKIECEDMPITPIVWNGRLFLFWLKILKQAPDQSGSNGGAGSFLPDGNISQLDLGTLKANVQNAAQAQIQIQAVLYWSEYYNGKWQSTKTSDIKRPATLGFYDLTGPDAFEAERDRVQITPAQCTGNNLWQAYLRVNVDLQRLPSDALILAISTPKYPFPFIYQSTCPGFVLYNTHSRPTLLEDILVKVKHGLLTQTLGAYLDWPTPSRNLNPSQPYTGCNGTGTLSIDYYDTLQSLGTGVPPYSESIIGFEWLPRYVEPQLGLSDAWVAPFFYEDRQNVFYVTTYEVQIYFMDYDGFGILSSAPEPRRQTINIPPLVFQESPNVSSISYPILAAAPVTRGGAEIVHAYLSRSTTIRIGIGSDTPVIYKDQPIYVNGSAAGSTGFALVNEKDAKS